MGPRHLLTCMLACMVTCGLQAGCMRDQAASPAPNVVVIVIDTLRADRLSFYGHDVETAPFLASLAARGLVFDNAWATSSWTAPATASIFTGLYPNQHGVRLGLRAGLDRQDEIESYALNRIPDELETLASFMQSAGYRTYGASANPNIDARLGFERGFDAFVPFDPASSKRATRISNEILAMRDEITDGDAPFFLYLHFADPHGPYFRHAKWIPENTPKPKNPLDDIAAYDSEIRFADEHIRKIFEGLGIGDETLVIMTADHGQEFLDHGTRGHGWQLYSELTRVPLFIAGPQSIALRGRSPKLVSGIDILPTLAALIDRPLRTSVSGTSALSSPTKAAGPRFSMRTRHSGETTAQLFSVVAGDHKLILHTLDGRRELYDLRNDPLEKRDLADARPALTESLAALIEAQRAAAKRDGHRAVQSFTPTPELLDQLEALGYSEGGPNSGER